MPETEERKINWFLWLIAISIVLVIANSFYTYYVKKNYDFIVEVACDPAMEECFQMDCSLEEDCPDGVYSFKRYILKAEDFKSCHNEDCESACETGEIQCKPVQCEPDILIGEACSASFENSETLE